ncbi:AraC family transcriptional regulator [Arenibacter sp. BSSL-BM3]|uniref:AraC family transcriptional regulator n=1 Tax=Arenibacter arenosicollis TaxID=2762274 RepID=A0ABR7QJH1_9FLAO|nr:AraC family transcriptional regulator [Arenibacter arenosicollis]MBC8767304.1 AraC family transcriptional regulator [Arenibacter arenosicollis]
MKLHLLNRASLQNSSFTVTQNSYSHFLKIWHYHPELELVYIAKSTGTRFIGDGIEKFSEGDLVLIGKNLPHMWLNDEVYFEPDSDLVSEAIAIHFKEDFLGLEFLDAIEMKPILQLIKRAAQGIKFSNIDLKVIEKIKKLHTLEPFEKTIKLIEILYKLANHEEYQLLSSPGFLNSFNKTDNKGLDEIYEFVFKNFNQPIGSKDVAEIAKMNPSAFSRFFKRIHRKTFTRYLNEIRIGYACKLLIENKNNITPVCYESGFNNISNFNRHFKSITGMSPSDYIKLHTQN